MDVGREEGCNIRKLGDGKHVIQRDLGEQTTIQRGYKPGSCKKVTEDLRPVVIRTAGPKEDAKTRYSHGELTATNMQSIIIIASISTSYVEEVRRNLVLSLFRWREDILLMISKHLSKIFHARTMLATATAMSSQKGKRM